jgi:predicted nucleotidyltransferase
MKKRLNSEKIIKRLKEERNELRKRGVKRIGLFGSYVKGKQKQKSDIDFLIEFKKIDADNFFNLLFLLERMFKRKIDLVDARNLRPELEYVKKEAKYVEI